MLATLRMAQVNLPGIIIGYNYNTNVFGGADNVIGIQDVEIIN